MRISRKKLAVLAGGLTVVAFAGAAFAYFTNTGSGEGDATVGTSSEIALSSEPVSGLFPGGADVDVTVDIHNPGDGVQYVGTISGEVESDLGADLEDDADDCLGSWFVVDDIVYNGELAPNGSAGDSDSDDTVIRMTAPAGVNQDACKTDTLTISWSSN